MACQICSSNIISSKILINDYEYDHNIFAEYKKCKNCTLIYRNKLKKSELKKLYTRNYKPVAGGIFYDILKKINTFYEWHIIKKINKKRINTYVTQLKFVDIGCGKGFLIEKISERENFNCVGIDINQNNIKKKKNLSFYKKSYKNLSLLKKLRPDYIILNNFIEHIESIEEIKKLFNSKNASSATFIILTPDSSCNSMKIFGKYWSGYHSPRHANIFNKKSLSLFLKNNNFEFIVKNIFDPLATLSSIRNSINDFKHSFSFKKLYKVCFIILLFPFDLFFKNRILVVCKKK